MKLNLIRPAQPGTRIPLLALAYASFVSLGLPDGLIGVAWPCIRVDFDLGLDSLGALFLTTTAGYLVSSIAAGPLAARLGVGGLLTHSTAVVATSLFGYAVAPGWLTMVALGLLAGAGGGAIDAALNAYAAARYSARTISLLHAFYGVGTTLGPLIMTTVLLQHLPWRRGYAIVAIAQLALAACFAITRRSWTRNAALPDRADARAPLRHTLRLRSVKAAMFVFFGYVGLESAMGAWIYSVLFEGRGVSMEAAGLAVGIYWGGLFAGRLIYALLPLRWSANVMLNCCMAACSIAVAAIATDSGNGLTQAAIVVLGLASGPIFPSLIATTPERVGWAHASNAVGLQVGASAAGVAVFPAGAGLLGGVFGIAVLPVAFTFAWLTVLVVQACFLQQRKALKQQLQPAASTCSTGPSSARMPLKS